MWREGTIIEIGALKSNEGCVSFVDCQKVARHPVLSLTLLHLIASFGPF